MWWTVQKLSEEEKLQTVCMLAHNWMQSNLRPKSIPNASSRVAAHPCQSCVRMNCSIPARAEWQSPGGMGTAGHLCTSPGRSTQLWVHPFSFDASHVKGRAWYSRLAPLCPWPQGSKATYPKVSSMKQSQVFLLISIQTSKGTFAFLYVLQSTAYTYFQL